jgi:hypothetical protein
MADDGSELWGRSSEPGEPMPPRAKPGYPVGYGALGEVPFWDESPRFFSPEERRTLEAVCERILPQDDRDDEHKIPIVPHIDERLSTGRSDSDGEHLAGMPPDPEAYRQGLEGIDMVARHMFGRPFVDLGSLAQDRVLKVLQDGALPAGYRVWERMPAPRFFMLIMRDVAEAFSANPLAWDELGPGAPAYPRGDLRLGHIEPEAWEVEEPRHAWEPSEAHGPVACEKTATPFAHAAAMGQGRTH